MSRSDFQFLKSYLRADSRQVFIVNGKLEFVCGSAGFELFCNSHSYQMPEAKQVLDFSRLFEMDSLDPDALLRIGQEKVSRIEIQVLDKRGGECRLHIRRIELEPLQVGLEIVVSEPSIFELFFSNSPDAKFLNSLEGRVLMVNQTACERLQYEKDELVGMKVLDFQMSGTELSFQEKLRKIRQDGKLFTEVVHRRRDGSLIPTEVNSRIVEIGGEKMILSIARDISERKANEGTILSQATLLNTLFESVPDLIWLKDPSGVYLNCNYRVEEFFGAKKSDIIGRTDYDFAEQSMADSFRTSDNYALKAGRPTKTEEVVKFASDGHTECLETIKTSLVSANGEVIGVLGVGRNISDRKKAEHELLINEERLRLALHGTQDAVWDWDLKSGNVYRSANWFAMLGYPPNSVDEPLRMTRDTIHPEDRARILEASRKAIEEGGGYSVEGRLKCADGSWKWILSRGQVSAKDKNGRATRLSGINTDIHLQKLAEEEATRLREQMFHIQKMESVGILAGGIAHDFNNHLAAISAYLELASLAGTGNEKIQRYMVSCLGAVGNSRALAQRMLMLSKGGSLVLKKGKVDQVVREAILKATAGSATVARFDFDSLLWHCEFDESQLGQAIMNLASNAVQSMEARGVLLVECGNVHELKTFPDGRFHDKWILISIKDCGAGIPKETLPKIFDPFFTTRKGASGLGLSIVHSIVAKHRGHVAVESSIGVGTEFKLYLPAAADDEGIEVLALDSVIALGGRVLLMDDQAEIRDSLSEMLQQLGFEVETTSSGEEALEAVRSAHKDRRPFTIALLDLTIPGGRGGKDVVREMHEACPSLVLVACSGFSEDPVISDPESFGFSGALAKPFSFRELSRVCKRCLQLAKSKRQAD